MCVFNRSDCRSMEQADPYAKLSCLSQPVGLLAILVDSAGVSLTSGQQKIFRHVCYAQTYNPHLCFSRDSCDHLEGHNSAAPQSSSMMPSSERKTQQRTVKKVHFAPDVVEPLGDSRAYRGRKDAYKVTHMKSCEETQGHIQMEEIGKEDNLTSPFNTKLSSHKRNCRKLVKSSLPANRLLLYKGMQCYKSRMMPC
ncbi:hypothetical protein L7F22_009119 [Adiantum nelumboides]|nr:hypothetical protein [Adiantum nelumboides]